MKNRINPDMTDIWDDLYEMKNADDLEDLVARISIVLQKGISVADQNSFNELQENLKQFLSDIHLLKTNMASRNVFAETAKLRADKYEAVEFDFEALSILDEEIAQIAQELDRKENLWKVQNLSL